MTSHHTEPSDASSATRRAGSMVCWMLILVSMSVSTARLMQARPLQSANDRSRWCTVRALVEQGTYRIDDVRRQRGWDTIDLVRHEGHFYSTKPPLFPTIVAGIYWGVRESTGWTFETHLEGTTRLILSLINILPMAAALVVLSQLLASLTSSVRTRVGVMMVACFGTLLLPFLNSLNNHTPAAACVVFAIAPAIRIVVQGRREWWRFAAVGFFSAFTFINELTAASLVAALGCVLAWHSPRRTLIGFVPAALIPVIAFFVLNLRVTDDWRGFYSAYGTEKYEFVHEGVPSYWMTPRGIDKATDSFPVYLLHCTIGHHGIFSLSPIWLLTLAGWGVAFMAWRRPASETDSGGEGLLSSLTLFHLMGAALTLIVFVFFMTRTENYNYGGVSVALRWLLWLVPFWLLGLIPLFDRWGGRWWMVAAGAVTLALSVFSAWYPLDGPWKQPWTFVLMEKAGWIDYSEPHPEFDRPISSWVYTLPAGPERDTDYWIELAGRDVDGRVSRLRLSDGGPDEVEGRAARVIEVTQMRHGSPPQVDRYWIAPESFLAGRGPAEFLLWPEGDPPDEQRRAAYIFWHGLPRPGRYAAGARRYLRFSLRTDAFHCLQGYATVATRDSNGERVIHRLDSWSCDEVPFGVVLLDRQVQNGRRQLLARERLEVSAIGRTLIGPSEPE